MSKYYNENKVEIRKISSYLANDNYTDIEKTIINYLITTIGDMELSEEMLKVFINQFNRLAGDYSVLVEEETIKGMYSFISNNRDLSPKAINELWPKYIKDLFEDYSLEEKYSDMLKVFGKNDETFQMFMIYVDTKAKELQEKYEEDAKRTDDLVGQYTSNFIEHLKYLITRKHIKYDRLMECLPEPSIIEEDENQLLEISRYYRIHFGVSNPISHDMVESLAKYNNLDEYDEEPKYYISTSNKSCPATFTKSQFLKTIEDKKKASQY
jgi:hypothetical protein